MVRVGDRDFGQGNQLLLLPHGFVSFMSNSVHTLVVDNLMKMLTPAVLIELFLISLDYSISSHRKNLSTVSVLVNAP